ncbi:MAG: hypothetical protein ACD_77C00384G0002 [uncultured bacterium]|nr:MAG: hypothetical protein ACD_77C00384G0002 [uncultured bacterium]HBY01962.1 phosphonate ABC transporter ATP-binding protein [Rikenellaceae bacterium]
MPHDYNEPLIDLSEIDIIKEESLIVSDLSLKLMRGDLLYLIGRVGSGKTSIVKSIIAEFPVYKGKAKVAGFNLIGIRKKDIPLLRRKIGVVFQDFHLLNDRSVYDNLKFVLESTGWRNEKDIEEVIKSKLDSVGMELKSHKMPHQLSGGEQQRVAIARALLNNPEIILADEPTGNLDIDTANEIMNVLMKIHKEDNPGIIIVTHNRSLIKRYPGRVMLCENLSCTEIEAVEEFDITQLMDEGILE